MPFVRIKCGSQNRSVVDQRRTRAQLNDDATMFHSDHVDASSLAYGNARPAAASYNIDTRHSDFDICGRAASASLAAAGGVQRTNEGISTQVSSLAGIDAGDGERGILWMVLDRLHAIAHSMSVAICCHKGQVAEEPVLLNSLDVVDPPARPSQEPRGTENNFLDSDVIKAVETLNAKVDQDASYMADSVIEMFEFENVTENPKEECAFAVQRASERIGKDLVRAMGAKARSDIRTLLVAALQVCLASTICTANPGERVLRMAIVSDISDILLAAGCTTTQSNVTSGITSRFKQDIASFVNHACRLHKMLSTANDFEVFIARPGETFDGGSMEDTEETQEAAVLCTTSIGLIKRVPLETGERRGVMVLKAKVMLESFLGY